MMDVFDENSNYLEWAKMHMEHDRLERANTCAMIAQAMISERQAAALERIAAVLENSIKHYGVDASGNDVFGLTIVQPGWTTKI